jgi:hypothetical protein
MGAICGATKGKYGRPVPVKESGISFIDEEYNTAVDPPLKSACGHAKHWQWGNGTRNGQKLYYPTNEMYVQKWELTEDELNKAVNEYDMLSIEVPTILICANCAEHELNNQ